MWKQRERIYILTSDTVFFYITSIGSQSGVVWIWLYCQVFLMLSPTHIKNGICCRIVVQSFAQITFCHKAPAESCYQGKTLRKTNELKYIYRCFCNKSSEINWWHFSACKQWDKTYCSLSFCTVCACLSLNYSVFCQHLLGAWKQLNIPSKLSTCWSTEPVNMSCCL